MNRSRPQLVSVRLVVSIAMLAVLVLMRGSRRSNHRTSSSVSTRISTRTENGPTWVQTPRSMVGPST